VSKTTGDIANAIRALSDNRVDSTEIDFDMIRTRARARDAKARKRRISWASLLVVALVGAGTFFGLHANNRGDPRAGTVADGGELGTAPACGAPVSVAFPDSAAKSTRSTRRNISIANGGSVSTIVTVHRSLAVTSLRLVLGSPGSEADVASASAAPTSVLNTANQVAQSSALTGVIANASIISFELQGVDPGSYPLFYVLSYVDNECQAGGSQDQLVVGQVGTVSVS